MTAPTPYPRPSSKVSVSLVGGPSCGQPTSLHAGPYGAPPPVIPTALGTYHRGVEREVSAWDGTLRWFFWWVPIPAVLRKPSYCKCANGGCPIWTHREDA